MKIRYNRNIRELFLRLLPVQIFLAIASGLSGIVNGLIVGNLLSDTAMSALGLTNPLTNLLGALSGIISGGAGILCGKYMGRGDARKVNTVFSNAIIATVSFGVVLSLFLFVGATPIGRLCGANDLTINDTVLFIRGISFGVLPLLLMPCLMTFLQMCNKAIISLSATILLAVCNTLYALFAIKVVGGGVFAVAFASSMGTLTTSLFMIIYLLIKKDLVKFDLKDYDLPMIKEMVVLGSPGSLAGVMYSIRNVFINSNASLVGGIPAINALAIMGSCDCFFDCLNVGVGNCLSMLASVFIGEKDARSLKDLMKTAISIGLLQCIFKVCFAIFLGKGIAIMFGAQGEAINTTWLLLVFYNLASPFNIFTLTFMGVYQALGRVKFCNMLYPVNCLIVPSICCFILSRFMGIKIIFACYMLAEIVTLICMYAVACKKKNGLAKNLDDMLYLDDQLDAASKYSISIKEIPEVVNVAQRVQDYCLANGIDKRRSMLAGLCMEEMAGNIVEHGFKKDSKSHSIDVFACVEDNEVQLRLRDNCVPFDPHSKLQMYENDDPVKNVGIKLVSRIAKEMNYQTTFGMNVLNIKL
ncbi:MAG: ATP-binding protein [Erysipelotrichaceae bacterium]|nr:ATP-binding protein [Erysipelotrichaceae bacterium]